MAENDDEGKPVEGGEQVAKPDSLPETAQPSTNLSALEERLNKLERENRALQSGKDRRWNEVMPVLKQVANMLGVDEKTVAEAQEKAVLQELVAERMARLQSPQPTTGTSGEGIAQGEVQTILQKYQLSSADAEVASKLKEAAERGWSNDLIRAEFADLALRRATKPSPSQSAAPPMAGGSSEVVLSDAEKDALYAKLKQLYKTPTKSAQEIKELEKRLGME